jgi:ribonuclease BN (tRNA processing enzyme)
MRVTIIGSGTGVPSPRRASPCILADTGSARLLLDTGPGSLRQLAHAGISLQSIDSIFYSHTHIDHTADLVPFIFASKYSPGLLRTRPLHIVGHPGVRTLYEGLAAAYGRWARPEQFAITWHEVRSGTLDLHGCSLTCAPVEHIESSIALRIDDSRGRSLVFSGDTEYCPAIVELARDCSMLILECSFPEHMHREGHLTPSRAARVARECACDTLVLTHLYPPCDECGILGEVQSAFSGRVVQAEDLMQLTVGA